jgi:Uma2 family endonuclease
MSILAQPRYTPEEYLARERDAQERSEYFNGQIYALAGASRRHNLITLNLGAELRAQLRGRPCEAYVSDMRVKVGRTGAYTYPDVVALCGEPRFEGGELETLVNPSMIIEVVSPSTEAHDRGEKFAHYRRLDSLVEYVLVAQDRVRVERYVRRGDVWEFSEIDDLDGTLFLQSIDCRVGLRSLYDRVDVSAITSAGDA